MTDLANIAVAAALVEEVDDLREAVEKLKPPEPERINYGSLADFLMARIEPRLTLLEDRASRIASDLSMVKMRLRTQGRRR